MRAAVAGGPKGTDRAKRLGWHRKDAQGEGGVACESLSRQVPLSARGWHDGQPRPQRGWPQALRRLVGGRDVMRGQAGHLLEARSLPNVTIQVIPYGAGAHPGMDGSFVILEFPDPDDPSIVYVESAAGVLFLEQDAEIRRYMLMFEHLRAAASGLDATAALLEAIVSER